MPKAKTREQKRESHFRRNYGISLEYLSDMLVEQEGKCPICRNVLDLTNMYSYAVDHNHQTGDVRGVLCKLCNASLGGFRDDPGLLKAAIDYLNKYAY